MRHFDGSLRVEVYAVAEAVAPQSLTHAGVQGLEDDAILGEFHLGLGRADVYIYGLRVHFQKKQIGRSKALRHHLRVGVHYRLMEIWTAEVASVDKEELVAKRLSCTLRTPYEAAYAHGCSAVFYFNDISCH